MLEAVFPLVFVAVTAFLYCSWERWGQLHFEHEDVWPFWFSTVKLVKLCSVNQWIALRCYDIDGDNQHWHF